jgi:hypothetical protein
MPGDSGSSLKERPAALAADGEEGGFILVMANIQLTAIYPRKTRKARKARKIFKEITSCRSFPKG